MALKDKSKKKFKFEPRSAESVKSRINQSSGGFDSYINSKFPRFKPSDGENRIRILPRTWKDTEKWGDAWCIEIWVHTYIGPDRSNFQCLQKMYGKRCPVCEERKNESDEKLVKKMAPQKKCLAWLIDRDDEKSGPQWWAMPPSKGEREIAARSLNKKTGAVIQGED